MPALLKVRLDENEGLGAETAIAVEKQNHSPAEPVTVTIWNGETQTSVALTGERARQVAMALISAFGGGGDGG